MMIKNYCLGAIALLIVSAGCGPLPEDKKTETNTAQGEGTQEAAPAAMVVTGKDLAKAYSDNEVKADDIYKGKLLEITGEIESINKDFADDVYVIVKGNSDTFQDLNCYFDSKEEAAGFKKGQKLTFTGTCEGLMVGNVVLKGCKSKL